MKKYFMVNSMVNEKILNNSETNQNKPSLSDNFQWLLNGKKDRHLLSFLERRNIKEEDYVIIDKLSNLASSSDVRNSMVEELHNSLTQFLGANLEEGKNGAIDMLNNSIKHSEKIMKNYQEQNLQTKIDSCMIRVDFLKLFMDIIQKYDVPAAIHLYGFVKDLGREIEQKTREK